MAIPEKKLIKEFKIRIGNRTRLPYSQAKKVNCIIKEGLEKGSTIVAINADDLSVKSFSPATIFRELERLGMLIKIDGDKHRHVKHSIIFEYEDGNRNKATRVLIPLKAIE